MKNSFDHITVLGDELVTKLNLAPGKTAVDCTAGGGGHTARLLAQVGPGGTVIAIDRDPTAISYLEKRFSQEIKLGCLHLKHANFADLDAILNDYARPIHAIAADLGVSSPQLDDADRGFSFRADAPLDMRMDPSHGCTAADIVNSASTEELTLIFQEFGEEPKARHLANCIVTLRQRQPISSTSQLADLCSKELKYKTKSRVHPATRAFQALRIAVNGELDGLQILLDSAFHHLCAGGRIAVISFHSLEDRLTKRFMQAQVQPKNRLDTKFIPVPDSELPAEFQPKARIIKPFPVVPSETEVAKNPRARSAKLRVCEKF